MEEQNSTLWIGDLDPSWDEVFLRELLRDPEIINVKIQRDKTTGNPSGYGFVECTSNLAAQKILPKYNNQPIPGTKKYFKLNWATYSSLKGDNDYAVYVGDLHPQVTDHILLKTFSAKFNVKNAKVLTDPETGKSKLYGFVRFYTEPDFKRALEEMNGQLCLGQPMQVHIASNTKRLYETTQYSGFGPANQVSADGRMGDGTGGVADCPPNENTVIFVGTIDGSVDEYQLRMIFNEFGQIPFVRIPPGKGCAFIQYMTRESAEKAIEIANGTMVGTNRVRVSWGNHSQRPPSKMPEAALIIEARIKKQKEQQRLVHEGLAAPTLDTFSNPIPEVQEMYMHQFMTQMEKDKDKDPNAEPEIDYPLPYPFPNKNAYAQTDKHVHFTTNTLTLAYPHPSSIYSLSQFDQNALNPLEPVPPTVCDIDSVIYDPKFATYSTAQLDEYMLTGRATRVTHNIHTTQNVFSVDQPSLDMFSLLFDSELDSFMIGEPTDALYHITSEQQGVKEMATWHCQVPETTKMVLGMESVDFNPMLDASDEEKVYRRRTYVKKPGTF
ncbi:putative Polyadenylate-binding protein [Blattamonas nauphoetae]|uniref:Polyadenylate-binding protein n=1 Tax=Blattamonas nauphoetae TaxID=2049346 RepID=A0ABQ9XEQ9_9EUKA|nr:putative Polyadenylate-binding protein [Blattamonas nauphoetae]